MLVIRIVGQHEAVVLIRIEKAFSASAGAHDDDGEGQRRIAPPLGRHGVKRQTDDAVIEVEIDVGEKRLHLRRREPFL